MTPETALARQIERYRRMTGEDRLNIALDLHAFACDIAREGIRRQFPNADDAEVDQRLRQRLEAAYR
jgi:Rv0078B-related antitoxin